MKPVYEIKFLGSKDFDKLPKTETNGSDISDSLGFYNPHTNRVFIRHTAIPELDKYLLEHEFDHILESEATDADENGIRHKKGKKFFKEIFLPTFTGFNAEQGSFSPLGILDPKNLNPKNNKEYMNKTYGEPQQDNMMMSPYGNAFGNQGSTPSFGVQSNSSSPFSGQESQSGFNQGLNQQTVNPLADPYQKYGRSAGRMYF